MNIYIKTNEAIAAYNRRNPKKKMTQLSLSEQVFKGESISDQSKLVYLSQWQSGKMIERCRIQYIVAICKATNTLLSDLVETR
jgi:hypothetical protein